MTRRTYVKPQWHPIEMFLVEAQASGGLVNSGTGVQLLPGDPASLSQPEGQNSGSTGQDSGQLFPPDYSTSTGSGG